MTTVDLGFRALPMTVVLAEGGGYAAALVAEGGWPADVSIELRFPRPAGAAPVVWPAVVDGDRAAWAVEPDEVAQLIAARPRKARLVYRAGDVELVWMVGPVDVL
jgi:hypothetical protein